MDVNARILLNYEKLDICKGRPKKTTTFTISYDCLLYLVKVLTDFEY